MDIALIRNSSVPLPAWEPQNQLHSIQRVAGSNIEVITSDKRRLIRQKISVRLMGLNLLGKVQERGHTIWIYDLSRLFASYKEIIRGLMFLRDHKTYLRSVKEGLNTTLDECPVDRQINYIGEFMNTHALEKEAASVRKLHRTRQGRPAKNCTLALNCIKSLLSGYTLARTAELNHTTRDYIYRHALNNPILQSYYLQLSVDEISSNTDEVYQGAMRLVNKIKTQEARS